MYIRLLFAVAVLVLCSGNAHAATDPVPLGRYGDWNAYTFTDSSGKVCFMSSAPKEQRGLGNRKRGEVLLFVTHWAGDGTKNVVSVSTGYPYRKNSTVKVKVKGKTFTMFTEGEMAWTNDQSTDDALALGIRQGSKLHLTGTSGRGTTTTDVYSLKGSGDAYAAITKACKM